MKKIKLSFLITFFLVVNASLFVNATNVTFRVDMQNQTVAPEGVHVAGSFQGWNPAGTLMTNLIGSIYTYTYSATPGEGLQWKYVNGDAWGEDESVPGACASGGNRYLTAPANDTILPTVCYGSCLPCILPKVNITFHVDMSNETISPSGVFLQGSFQDPAWSGVQMTAMGNDIYATTVIMSVGEFHEYKFLNGTTYETVPPECGYGGYSNRYLTVPATNTTLPLVCFGSCDPCTVVTDINVTFRVDMSETTPAPVGVHIAGGFQGWNPSGTLLTDMGNGIWQTTFVLQSGTYHEYKFVNGDAWGQDETVPWYCNNNGNRFLTVPNSDTILTAVCYATCLVCNPPQVNVTFQVDMSLQNVSPLGVHLAGTLQGWNPASTEMLNIGNNVYEVMLTLGEGEFHEYKFINGNDWPDAETVPGGCAGLGGNREFFVPSVNTTLDLVCFAECAPCVIPTHTFDLNVFLEGPFNGTSMNYDLDVAGKLPINQPYNMAPWNYAGTENISIAPTANITDWVLVELRNTDGDASTATPDKRIHRQAALLLADGSIVKTNGSGPIEFTGAILNNLYVIIWQRNHLAVMSANPLTPTDGNYVYDFTNSVSKAYLDGQKQIGLGVYGMIGGDSDANGTVNSLDKTQWNSKAGKAGYLNSDNDLDGQSDNIDKNEIWDLNNGLSAPLLLKCNPFIDPRDGQSYNTVAIGTQCWMQENLNIGIMIPGVNDPANNGVIEKYCFENSTTNCDVYGGLYLWNEMMQYVTTPGVQGICPAGWHLPTNAEWTVLTTFLGGESVAGGKIKSTGTFEAGTGLWRDPNYEATNSSGFTALPGGFRGSDVNFHSLGYDAYIWSSTEDGTGNAFNQSLYFNYADIFLFSFTKEDGFSVRCVKN
jgi:uncharacterized protein (TIGR02145 family)